MCAAGSTWRPPWVEADPKPNHPEPFGTGWLAWGCAKGGTNCKRLLFPCVECLGKRIEGMADKPQFQVALSRDWGELLHALLGQDGAGVIIQRSAERRVGKECVSRFRSRCSPVH